jgi:O-antigen ligase
MSLQNRPDTWRAFALGSASALFMQIMIGFWQFSDQATAFLKPLHLNWPGNLTAAVQGASVVQLADGIRWLRVYGTLPHPNILGGLVFVFLCGLATLYLNQRNRQIGLLCLFGLGVVLLILTFSRSSWLAFAIFGVLLAIFSGRFDRRRLLMLLLVTLISLAIFAFPLHDLIFARTGGSDAGTETFSTIARTWLTQQGLEFFRERPLLGWGIGSFILELSQRAGYGYIIEPVHNIPLLVISELGLGGALLLVGLVVAIVWQTFHAKHPNTIIFAAMLVSLGVIAMFDHYLWTLSPGRMLLGLSLGLFAGQSSRA